MRQLQCNAFGNRIKETEYLIVREAKHLDSRLSKKLLSYRVPRLRTLVGRAVYFNYYSGFRAVEINDKSPDCMLAPELEPQQSTATKPLPQRAFRRCSVVSHFPSLSLS